eukprot:scaffold164430_cov46-Prasinocladus_malaysianus.AAC.2
MTVCDFVLSSSREDKRTDDSSRDEKRTDDELNQGGGEGRPDPETDRQEQRGRDRGRYIFPVMEPIQLASILPDALLALADGIRGAQGLTSQAGKPQGIAGSAGTIRAGETSQVRKLQALWSGGLHITY